MPVILLGFVILAGLQWLLIKRIPWRIFRIFIQVPLLAITVLGTMYLLTLQGLDNRVADERAVQDSILDTSIVSTGDLVISVSGTGSITPIRQVSLTFAAASAPVARINLEQGDTVSEGQLIAELDNTDLQQAVNDAQVSLNLQQSNFDALNAVARPEDLAAAEAAVAAAQAQVNSAFATGASAEDREIARLQAEIARNQLWQIQLNRDSIVDNPPTPLSIPNASSLPDPLDDVVIGVVQSQNASNQAAYDAQSRQAESSVNQAEYGVQIADASNTSTQTRYADPGALASANASLVQAQVSYERLVNGATDLQIQQAATDLQIAELNFAQVQLNLEQSQLTAPFSGTIAQMNLTIGEMPPQGIAVLLIDTSSFYVDVPIDETDIAQIAIGQRVVFEVDALPNSEVLGIVSSIAYAPIEAQDVNLVAYNVRIQVLPSDTAIRAGMTVTSNIITLERESVLLVRNNFIRIDRNTGDAFVTVRNEAASLEERLILLGERNDVMSEVLAGLSEGEELVLLPRTSVALGD